MRFSREKAELSVSIPYSFSVAAWSGHWSESGRSLCAVWSEYGDFNETGNGYVGAPGVACSTVPSNQLPLAGEKNLANNFMN